MRSVQPPHPSEVDDQARGDLPARAGCGPLRGVEVAAVRRFHVAVGLDDDIPSRRRHPQSLYECFMIDCNLDHVYVLDRFEGQALNDLLDERRAQGRRRTT